MKYNCQTTDPGEVVKDGAPMTLFKQIHTIRLPADIPAHVPAEVMTQMPMQPRPSVPLGGCGPFARFLPDRGWSHLPNELNIHARVSLNGQCTHYFGKIWDFSYSDPYHKLVALGQEMFEKRIHLI